MGPPIVQGVPAVPKMGVRARVSDLSQRSGICISQPPRQCDGLVLTGPHHSGTLLKKSLELQVRSESRYPLCAPFPRSSLMRMKRSNSEVIIGDAGAEVLDPAAVNLNTGASLRRAYGSTSTLDRLSLTDFMEMLVKPSAPPPPLPEPPHFKTSLSQSLQTTTQVTQGDVLCATGHSDVDTKAFYCEDRERVQSQRNKPSKMETWIFSKLRGQRTGGDHTQRQDRFSGGLTPPKCFSHYDVQSIFFNISASYNNHAENTTTGALTTSKQPGAPAPDLDKLVFGHNDLDRFSHNEDGTSNSLVLSCPFFLNEIGGETHLGLTQSHNDNTVGDGSCSRCSNAGVSVLEGCKEDLVFPQNLMKNCNIEHIDLGARYYLKYFYNRDHQNYFGVDENFGPVSLSIRREKLDDRKDGTQYNHRIILRTSQLSTLRGSVLEDSIPSSSKHGTSRGLPLKDVMEFVVPELNLQSLRLAASSPQVSELLLQLDQQELNFQVKVGVLFCRAGQTTVEQMYNNKTGSPALDQFMDLLGHKVQLKGFTQYKAHLDTAGDSKGSHSVYTKFREFELMFNVSTLLPFTANDCEQPLRERHIGNNIITIVFQEPDAPPFSPINIHSHLQHVFIIVRVQQPCSQHTCYRVAVSRCADVPFFGPLIPAGPMFPACSIFKDFLLTKIINAYHAVHRSEKFIAMATHRRQVHLKDLVENFATSASMDSSVRFSFISLAGKKERRTPRPLAHLQSTGALTWSVNVAAVACRLAISNHLVVLIEEATRHVVFSCDCRDVIGWSTGHAGIKLFYEHGDCVRFSTRDGNWDNVREISQRLQVVTRGGMAVEMTLRRDRSGQLGFHVNSEGVVGNVEAYGFAWQAGLRSGCRLMEICGVAVVTLSHEQMIELLRMSAIVNVVVIPPNRDGAPCRSLSEIYHVQLTWHQVPAAPSLPITNQSVGSQSTQSFSDMKEGSRMRRLAPVGAPPDWAERTRSAEAVQLRHPHRVPDVLRKSQQSPTESINISECHRFGGKCEEKLDLQRLNCADEPSTVPLSVATATLVLGDIWGDGSERGVARRVGMKNSPGHVTDMSDACSLSSDSGCRGLSECSLEISSMADSPGAFLTCAGGMLGEEGLHHHHGVCPCEWEGPNTSIGGSVVEDTDGLQLPSDLQLSSHPNREVSVSGGEKAPSSWRSLARTMSDDSLYRRTVTLPSSRTSLLMSRQSSLSEISRRWRATPRRSELSYSESSLVERSNMADACAFKATGVCSSSSLTEADRLHQDVCQSAALQDSRMAASLSGKVFQMEETLRQLQQDLLKEQQDKAVLQQQVLNLRQNNLHLQEQRQSAADQIRCFTLWMLRNKTLP